MNHAMTCADVRARIEHDDAIFFGHIAAIRIAGIRNGVAFHGLCCKIAAGDTARE